MKDTRNFEEMTPEEQQQLMEWGQTFLFPTMNGGLSMSEIQEECWFSTGRPDPRPGWEGYEDLWYPSSQAILTVMKELGYQQQAIKMAGARKGEVTLFYNVQLYTACLPAASPMPTQGTMRDRWDWSFADEVRERETQKAKKTAYSWSPIVIAVRPEEPPIQGSKFQGIVSGLSQRGWVPEEPPIQREGRIKR